MIFSESPDAPLQKKIAMVAGYTARDHNDARLKNHRGRRCALWR